jgi:putative hemolysin
VAAITYASLILGELVPKQIALRNPEKVAVKIAPAMTLLSSIASPLVFLLNASGRGVLWLPGQHRQSEEKVTEEEIRTLVAEAERTGVLEPGEKDMISGVMSLGDRHIRAVMTPRRQVDVVDLSCDPAIIRRDIMRSPHSRLPVHEGNSDEVIGIIQAKDLLNCYLGGNQPDLRQFIRAAPIIPDSLDAA